MERRREERTPQLDATVVPAGNDEPIVELEAGDRVVVRAQAVACLERGEVEYDDAAVGPTSDEDVRDWVELELTDERGVALEEREEFTKVRGDEVSLILVFA